MHTRTSSGFSRRRRALAVALSLPLLSGAGASARNDAQGPALPADVRAFLEQREQCDHWRSEEPYDRERRLQIERNACRSCRGTDARLAALRAKYKRNGDVIGRLRELEAAIEPHDEDSRRACAAARARRD